MRDAPYLPFSHQEFARRLDELRERMAYRGLDAVIISHPANVFYLTGYQTTGYTYFQCVVVPLEREPFMVTRQMEASNVEKRTWIELIRPFSDTGDAIQMLLSALREFGIGPGARLGYERNSYFFPAYLQDRFHTSPLAATAQDCSGIVEAGRIRKSAEEIAVMKQAALAAEAGMRAGYESVGAGVSENEIAGDICHAMFTAGGEYPAVLPYVTTGPRSMIGHATWEGRPIRPGEHAFLEVGGCVKRYHVAMMRTVVLADALSPALREAESRMIEALDAVHALVRPGVTVADVDMTVRKIITDNHYGADLVTRAGYSIGIAFAPSWDEGYILSLKAGDGTILESGMTFHVIPWMWGLEGDKTVGISDTIRVTDDGCESFFTLPREMVVKPPGDEAVLLLPGAVSEDAVEATEAEASNDDVVSPDEPDPSTPAARS